MVDDFFAKFRVIQYLFGLLNRFIGHVTVNFNDLKSLGLNIFYLNHPLYSKIRNPKSKITYTISLG